MSKFKAGDVVRCVNANESSGALVENSSYRVAAVNVGDEVFLEGLKTGSWRQDRFELLEDSEPQQETKDIRRIQRALHGQDGPLQQLIAEQIVEWGSLLLRKNKDYGCAVFNVPELAPECGAATAIRVRMSDKISRLRNLLKSDSPEIAESIEDTISDLGAYCLLLRVAKQLEANPPEAKA